MHTIGLVFANAVDRQLLTEFLQTAGHGVQTANPTRFEPAELRQASLIIVDEAAARQHGPALVGLKQAGLYLPVLVALRAAGRSTSLLEAGFDDVLRLPVTKAELGARLGVFLRLREQFAAQYQSLVENALVGLYRLTPDGRLTMANPALARLLGQPSADACVGRTLDELGFQTDPPRWAVLRQLEREGALAGLEAVWRRADGTQLFVRENARATWHPDGRLRHAEGTLEDMTPQRQAEAALAGSERRFRAMIEQSSDVIVLVEADARIRYVSPAVERVLGYTPEELVGGHAFDLVLPEDQARAQQTLQGLLAQPGHTLTVEIRAFSKAGQVHWLECTNTNLLHEPSVEAIVSNFRDITARKQAEAQMAYQAHLLEHISDAVVAVDAHFCITAWNTAAEALYGWTAAEALGREVGDVLDTLVPNEDRAALRQRITTAGHWRGQANQRRKDGTRIEVEVATISLVDGAGQFAGLASVARDITARLEAERARAHLATIVASSEDAIIGKTLDGTITSWNAGAERLYGYTAEEIIGQPSTLLAAPERTHEMIALLARLAQGEYMQHFETQRRRKDGRLVDVSVSISPIRNAAGELIGASSIARDVTERKRIEAALAAKGQELAAMNQQLWQAAKLATMGELAASIAHELNNPLAIISLRLEALRASLAPGDERIKALAIVEAELERMANLVAELLQSTRRRPQVSTVDLRAELHKALDFIHHHLSQRGILVNEAYSPDLPLVQADRQLLRQVFLNLLTNASDAMPDGGELSVIAANGYLPNGDPAVEVVVQDTGSGIPPEALAHIWEPFFTTKPEGKGTGLGLPICRRILQEHGGAIEVSSVVGEGTQVRLVVPVNPPVAVHNLDELAMPGSRRAR